MSTTPANHLGMQQLRFFAPFETLGDDQLILLSGKIRLEQAAEGARLLSFDTTDPQQYFLLDGVVEIEARDGMRRVIESGTEHARAALAAARPCEHNVVALSPVRLLKLDGGLLENLAQASAAGNADAHDATIAGHPLYQRIREDLLANRFVLPSLPEVALRVRKAIENETANVATIAKIVNADPAIAAKLIKAANGPLYRGSVQIETCQAAIVRLGMKVTKQLVMSFTLRDLFKVKDAGLKRRIHETWRHSMEIGAISMVLARLARHLEPEQALLAGLVHDIGVVPILCYAQNHPELLTQQEELDPLIRQLRGEIGGLILRHWGFSEQMVRVAARAEDWHYDGGETADYCDLVIIAHLHGGEKAAPRSPLPETDQVPAFRKLGPDGITPQARLEVIEEAKNQITDLIRLLSA